MHRGRRGRLSFFSLPLLLDPSATTTIINLHRLSVLALVLSPPSSWLISQVACLLACLPALHFDDSTLDYYYHYHYDCSLSVSDLIQLTI